MSFCTKIMIVKLNKTVWSVTLIAVFAILVNNAVFEHTHILADGRVVEHAHPFNSAGKNSGSQPNHHHTSQEFLLLSHIYHFFSSAYPLFIVMLFFNGICRKHLLFESKVSYSPNHKRAKSSRAPPQLLFSL